MLAARRPEAAVEIVRQQLRDARYLEVLRGVLRMRTDPETGRSWTGVQELVCRCAFKAVVTTNYDPGIVNARMRVRPVASATGFITWQDELSLDRWRTGEVFGEDELPVLFAHGQHNRPDSVVLATAEYRRAYQGKLPHVLGQLMDSGHLVWIGFSFADQRITAILREIAQTSGTRVSPGTAPPSNDSSKTRRPRGMTTAIPTLLIQAVSLVRGAAPHRDEVGLPQRTIKKRKEKRSAHSPPLSIYSAPGGLRQDPGDAA